MKIVKIIQWIALVVFILSAYYRYLRKPKQPIPSQTHRIDNLPACSLEDRNPGTKCTAAEISEVADAETLLKSGRFIPYSVDSQFVGFRFCGLEENSPFTKACLRNGDIIEGIDNTKLETPETGFGIIDTFLKPGTTEFQILRDGKPALIKLTITK